MTTSRILLTKDMVYSSMRRGGLEPTHSTYISTSLSKNTSRPTSVACQAQMATMYRQFLISPKLVNINVYDCIFGYLQLTNSNFSD